MIKRLIRLLHSTVLKPKYSLRRQLWFAFGSISALAIAVVCVSAAILSVHAGKVVTAVARETLQKQVIRTIQSSSEYLADTLVKKMENLGGAVAIIAAATQDRFYSKVPFFDMIEKRYRYPLEDFDPPLEWELFGNVNESNFDEHLCGQRYSWYQPESNLSTASAKFRSLLYSGAINPDEETFLRNKTEELRRKSSTLQYILKPLYEAHDDIKLLGVFYRNEGIGASLVYPSYANFEQGAEPTSFYTSSGCDWLRVINPFTNKPLATEEEIARCHPEGELVPAAEYNPLERVWCREQALHFGESTVWGPYQDAFNSDLWLVAFGKAVFSEETGEFVACALADISVEHINTILQSLSEKPDVGDVTGSIVDDVVLVQWFGSVIAQASSNGSDAQIGLQVEDLDFISDSQAFEDLKNLIHEDNALEAYRQNVLRQVESRYIVAAYPVPLPPSVKDPDYIPDAILLVSVSEDVFRITDSTRDRIKTDVRDMVAISVSAGVFGLIIVFLQVWLVSRFLTRPFEWMERKSQEIVQHHVEDENESTSEKGESSSPVLRCMPKTEISGLVSEFQRMIEGFSGEGPAQVADSTHEIRNRLGMYNELEQLRQRYYAPELGSINAPNTSTISQKSLSRETANLSEPDQPQLRDIQLRQSSLQSSFLLQAMDASDETESSSSASGDQNNTVEEAPEPIQSARFIAKEMDGNYSLMRLHRGRNVADDGENEWRKTMLHADMFEESKRVSKSRLFWWIVVLIVIPLLITIGFICAQVYTNITETLPGLVDETKESSFLMEQVDVISTARSRAIFAAEALLEPVRNSHLHRRFAAWLFFGAINRTDSFTEVIESAEECKTYPPNQSCPFFQDKNLTPCDCSWGESHVDTTCTNYQNPTTSRYLQRRFFEAQSRNADPLTGARYSVSIPYEDTSAAATMWWDSPFNVPGSEKGSSAAGYATTYDRIRVSSAMAVVELALFNYESPSQARKRLGSYIGLEADGMITGYGGCDYSFAEMSHFQSTVENGAASIRGELCPLGKFGYDSRCRSWYETGKEARKTHLTPPYVFPNGEEIASSITASIVDPVTNEHVGQALVDFILDDLLDAARFTSVNGRFSIVITPGEDALGGDTVAAPGYSFGTSPPPIETLILPFDEEDSVNRAQFKKIVKEMKLGAEGTAKFRRTRSDGMEETIFISFSPVNVRTLEPVNSSSFDRGVESSLTLMYSWAVAIREDDLSMAFDGIDETIQDELTETSVTFLAVMATTSVLVTIMIALIAVSITVPVIILHRAVKCINSRAIQDDLPPMEGGSREVNQVYNSFSKLYKVMRFSNSAFFSGNMKWAHKFLSDALALFHKVGDEKALGIASNNLGNTLLSIFRDKAWRGRCHAIGHTCVFRAALECYNKAVELGLADYEHSLKDDVDDSVRAQYAQQLANRYFNRGMFYLITETDPCSPDDAFGLGIRDLKSARNLDMDVRDYWITTRQVKSNSSTYFDRLVRRGGGLVQHAPRGVCCVYDPLDVLHEADSLLMTVGRDARSPLTQNVRRTGRLQELEEISIRYELAAGNLEGAAYFAARMLVEDEYLLESAFEASSTALMQYLQADPMPAKWRVETVDLIREQIRLMVKSCAGTVSIPFGKNVVFCVDLDRIKNEETFSAARSDIFGLVEEVCNDHDFIGFAVANTGFLPMRRKKNIHLGTVEKMINESDVEPRSNALRQMIKAGLDVALAPPADEARRNDSWIIVISDNSSFNGHYSVLARPSQVNEESTADVNLILVGIEMNAETKEKCQSLCTARNLTFIEVDADASSLGDAIGEIASKLAGRPCIRGITVEKF